MAQISRLHNSTITSGHFITASDLGDEFNQLVSESNAQDTRLTNIESQAVSFTGVKTFTNGIITDTITERSTSAGVTIAGVNNSRLNLDKIHNKTSGNLAVVVSGGITVFSQPIKLSGNPVGTPVTGEVWFSTTNNVVQFRDKTTTQSVGNSSGRLLGVTTYLTGTNTFTPNASTKALEIWCTGGGGAGGNTASSAHQGAGGGASGTSYAYYTSTMPASLSCVVGTGGAAVSAGSNGNNGVDSTVTGSGAFSTLTGVKGLGGLGTTATVNLGGAGGSASGGNLAIVGGDGIDGAASGGASNGGASMWGGGGQGNYNTGNASAGLAFGSGGGGQSATGNSGAGAPGVILIKEFS